MPKDLGILIAAVYKEVIGSQLGQSDQALSFVRIPRQAGRVQMVMNGQYVTATPYL